VSGDFPVQLATSRTRTTILADLSDTRAFPREDPVRDASVYTCKRVLYTTSYRVHVYKVHDRRIPNVGVRVRIGVGPVEFQFNEYGRKRQLFMPYV